MKHQFQPNKSYYKILLFEKYAHFKIKLSEPYQNRFKLFFYDAYLFRKLGLNIDFFK